MAILKFRGAVMHVFNVDAVSDNMKSSHCPPPRAIVEIVGSTTGISTDEPKLAIVKTLFWDGDEDFMMRVGVVSPGDLIPFDHDQAYAFGVDVLANDEIEFHSLLNHNSEAASKHGVGPFFKTPEAVKAPESDSKQLSACDALAQASDLIIARGGRYGADNGGIERQFDVIADAFNVIRNSAKRINAPLNAQDVTTLLMVMNLCRAQTDNDPVTLVSLLGYGAIAAEIVGGRHNG